jgi:circadian clock protein KaiC
MVGDVAERCPTGIVGFDELCQGGFVRNSDNLIVGGPGSGKSTFLLQFLWNGVTMFNENGLYCSFEPDIVDILNDGVAYGWDFTKLSSEGRIKFMRFSPRTSVDDLKDELMKIISRNNIGRICFDPISVLALNLSDGGKIRQTIYELSALMKRLRVTTLFADESLEESFIGTNSGDWTKTDILRFLSDSVVVFYESGVAGTGDRAVRIAKMRRTAHERRAVPMKIEDDGIKVAEGVVGDRVTPVQEREEVYVARNDANPQTPTRLDVPSQNE